MLPSSILPAVPTTLLTWTHTRVDPELFWFHQLENILSFFTSEVEFPFLKYLFDNLSVTDFVLLLFLLEINFALYNCTFQILILIFFFLEIFFTNSHLAHCQCDKRPRWEADLWSPRRRRSGTPPLFCKKLFSILQVSCLLRNISFFSCHLVFWDLFDHSWRGNPRFWATDLTGLDAAGLVVPATNNYNVERQWKLQGVTSAQGKFYLVLRRKFHQSLV